MKPTNQENQLTEVSRCSFLKTSATAALAGATATSFSRVVNGTAKTDILRVAFIGCGGRGVGAAAQALQADPHAELVALGDVFI